MVAVHLLDNVELQCRGLTRVAKGTGWNRVGEISNLAKVENGGWEAPTASVATLWLSNHGRRQVAKPPLWIWVEKIRTTRTAEGWLPVGHVVVEQPREATGLPTLRVCCGLRSGCKTWNAFIGWAGSVCNHE